MLGVVQQPHDNGAAGGFGMADMRLVAASGMPAPDSSLTLTYQPRRQRGTFGEYGREICQERMRTAEISAVGQAHVRYVRRG